MTGKTTIVPPEEAVPDDASEQAGISGKCRESSPKYAESPMNELSAAHASAALACAHARFHRVLAGWASDVLRLEREVRLGRAWPGAATHRSAA